MIKIIAFGLLFAFSLASCSSPKFVHHTPTLANTGNHTKGKQLTGSLNYSTGRSGANHPVSTDDVYERNNGFQMQGSYSVTDNIALQGAFMTNKERSGIRDDMRFNEQYGYRRNIAEFGGAYFKSFDDSRKIFFSLGVGAGFGNYKETERNVSPSPENRFFTHHVFKLYFLPLVYWANFNSTVGVGARLSSIKFNNISTNYTTDERNERGMATDSELNTTTLDFFVKGNLFLTPKSKVGACFQVLIASELGREFNGQFTEANYSVGMVVRLGEWLQKK